MKKSGGLEPAKVLVKAPSPGDTLPTCWTPDGKQILTTYQSVRGGSSLVLISVDGTRTPFLNSGASETNGQISPDGKWLIYASNESGDWEIYATTFPTPTGKLQVSRGGGTEPRWRGDGKEIFYLAPGSMLTAVSVTEGTGTLLFGTLQPLFQMHGRAPISSSDLFTYDVARDGRRFLVNRYLKPTNLQPLNIILNSEGPQ